MSGDIIVIHNNYHRCCVESHSWMDSSKKASCEDIFISLNLRRKRKKNPVSQQC